LYLDAEKVAMLAELAKKTGETQQTLLRQAIDVLLKDYERVRKRSADRNVHILAPKRKS
jgi:predicted DNA-binding protein